MGKILLFCPTYVKDGHLQLWPDSRASFDALRAPAGVEVVRWIGLDNPYPNGKHKNTLHQYQQAQKRALEEGFDALCTFENDMIVPEDGLEKLWETPAEVVYGLYILRHGANCVNAFREMKDNPNLGESLSFWPKEYLAAEKQGWAKVSGCGTGLTLIRRAVLERIPLRAWEENNPPDWALAHDCQAAGILQICRFDVKCGHIEDDGRILWAGKDPRMMVKVRVLTNFVGDVGKGNQPFHAGEELEAPYELAWDYMRAGFMELLEKIPQQLAQAKMAVETMEGLTGEISKVPEAKRKRK